MLGWMLVIFMFSAQTGEKSAKLSGGITERVLEVFVKDFAQMPAEQQLSMKDEVGFVVRKLAHYTEYLILGFLLMNLIRTYDTSCRKGFLLSWGLGTLYAFSDELHQIFSEGRSPQLRDVCIDSAGVLTGTLLVLLLMHFYRKTIDKRGKKELS